jgi:cob(I)alamin adenosyltransferase
MKIYTRTGDDGTTGLIGGRRVGKDDSRIQCVGEVDELNAAMGWCAVAADASFGPQLQRVQGELFVLGAQLAAAEGSATLPKLDEEAIGRLESEIDAASARLAELRNFILPGGTELAARLHLARTICRRAERAVVTLLSEQPRVADAVHYLNRLSDWLFVQGRLANALAGQSDIIWNPPRG